MCTRRDFLRAAGALGGSTAVYRAAMGIGLMPVAARAARPVLTANGASKKVLILGAGISGLTAAYELQRRGYEVQVLEASFRAGGRNLTLRGGDRIDEIGYPQVCQFDRDPDLFFNAGPARIPGHHQNLLEYCKELDVPLAPFINDNRNAWVQDDAMFGGKPIRAPNLNAEWCLQSVNQCWSQKLPRIAQSEAAAARKAYDHARQVYMRLISESPSN